MYKSASDRENFRVLFDTAIERAEKGLCKLYGCAFEQAAQESKAGGYFTQALIQAGNNWKGSGVFTLRNAYEIAESTVRQKNSPQTPESELGRRLYHFPFAVQP